MCTNALMLGGGKKIKSMVSSGGTTSLECGGYAGFILNMRALVVNGLTIGCTS